jgi:UDPglucose 6-dehydrogenase
MDVNDRQRYVLAEKIKQHFDGDLSGKTIAIWGLAFKPNTDDIREAPALYIMEELLKAGAKIKAFDPEAMHNIKALFGDRIQYAGDQYEALIEADALAIITEWSVFRTPSFKVMKELLKEPLVFDGRNLYDLERMKELGFHYNSIGRNPVGTVVVSSNHA